MALATSIVMPALEMAQETGKLIRWLKREGDAVVKGQAVMEIETDKVTVEIEATDSGILGGISAHEGDVVPVGRTIAWILAPGESAPALPVPPGSPDPRPKGPTPGVRRGQVAGGGPVPAAQVSEGEAPVEAAATASVATGPWAVKTVAVAASPLARKLAEEHGIDLALVKSDGRRIEKADVLAYLGAQAVAPSPQALTSRSAATRLSPASPKARRLAAERDVDLALVSGSGPGGAVLAADVSAAVRRVPDATLSAPPPQPADVESLGTVWRLMAERMTGSWTSVPHFYLMREVSAQGLLDLRARVAPAVERRIGVKPTFTDLLVKLVAAALREHPRLNASWVESGIRTNREINVGIATAIEAGLIVPVIQHANQLTIGEIAAQRSDLVARANENKLRPSDIAGGTFTITNLGMYNVDVFNAIVNPPQAAILAVGRIADRVVPVNGEPVVRPMLIVSLSCDHRVVDGARAAKFLDDLANLIEDPWGVLA